MFIPHDLEKLLESLREFSIIVEGKKDKKALNALGIYDVIEISGKSFLDFVKFLKRNKKYLILTDFDEEGEKKNKILLRLLSKEGFSFDSNLRKRIKKIFKIRKIEELIKISKLKEDVYHGKISSINYKVFNRSRFYRRWCSREARCYWGNIWPN